MSGRAGGQSPILALDMGGSVYQASRPLVLEPWGSWLGLEGGLRGASSHNCVCLGSLCPEGRIKVNTSPRRHLVLLPYQLTRRRVWAIDLSERASRASMWTASERADTEAEAMM